MIRLSKYLFTVILACLLLSTVLPAQIVVLQYRSVPQENIEEFLHRETTYWSQIAKKAIDDGKMNQWELWQRFGGMNMDDDSYNFVFTNTFPDKAAMDNMGAIWNPAAVLPNVRPADLETNSLSHVVHTLVIEQQGATGVQSNFIRVNYAQVSDMTNYLRLENENWKPFITKMMEEKKTSCVGWGVWNVIYPQGTSMPFNGFTVDYYNKLSEAVLPSWGEEVEFPDFTEYGQTMERVKIQVYGLVKRVMASE
jgi:hypothetical protein